MKDLMRARCRVRRAYATAASMLLVLCVASSAAHAQRRGDRDGFMRYFGDPNEYYTPPAFRGNVKYDGRFTWVRLKYRGYARMSDEGPGWSHDYPRSDTHLMKIMREVTSMRPFLQRGEITGGNILAMDDPELMKYPVAYLSEPGGWQPNDKEVAGLSTWFQKGGFLIVDDFGGPGHWMNLVQQMQRVLPKAKIVQLDAFDLAPRVDHHLTGPHPGVDGPQGGRGETPRYIGIVVGIVADLQSSSELEIVGGLQFVLQGSGSQRMTWVEMEWRVFGTPGF